MYPSTTPHRSARTRLTRAAAGLTAITAALTVASTSGPPQPAAAAAAAGPAAANPTTAIPQAPGLAAPSVAAVGTGFLDVAPTHPFAPQIAWLAARGISTGWPVAGGPVYRPSAKVTREAMAAFLYRAAGAPAYTPPTRSPFADVAPGQAFYREICWMYARGISTGWTVGSRRYFRPGDPITREAMAAFLYRASGAPAYTPPATSPFVDVRPGQAFATEISWMFARAISTGWLRADGAREYRPALPVSREAMAAFLFRRAGLTTPTAAVVASCAGTCVTLNSWYEDHGSIALRGALATPAATTAVTLTYTAPGATQRTVSLPVSAGTFATNVTVTAAGTFSYAVSLGAATLASGALPIADTTVVLDGSAGLAYVSAPYRLTGRLTPALAGRTIGIESRRPDGTWAQVATVTTGAGGAFAGYVGTGAGALTPVRLRAAYRVPNRTRTEYSSTFTVNRTTTARVVVTAPTAASTIDAPATVSITGYVEPRAAGERVWVEDLIGTTWTSRPAGATTTGGAFRLTLDTGRGRVGSFTSRVAWQITGTATVIRSAPVTITRVARLSATTHPTLRTEVALSYRPGCPVGPAQLTTIDMNHWGFDGLVHRGRLIVRTDVVPAVIAAFQAGFDAKYPIRVMQDPSAYGNDDRRSMAADNTYAFSCRPVTGNPGVVSPHSYGRALDVNPVENPYREPNGTWSPANGAPFIDRSVRRPGMLYADSPLTRALTSRGFAWYVGWDYQHFQR